MTALYHFVRYMFLNLGLPVIIIYVFSHNFQVYGHKAPGLDNNVVRISLSWVQLITFESPFACYYLATLDDITLSSSFSGRDIKEELNFRETIHDRRSQQFVMTKSHNT